MPTDVPAPDVTDPADLYSLPLDRFTASRDLLARWLRSRGSNDEATTVARLRKPSLAAWGLNRASRSHPDLVERLRESHRQLRAAKTTQAMQSASEMRNRAVSALVEAAVTELQAAGRPETSQTRDRITSTVLAVATDPEGEAALEEGRLVRDLEPSGTGWGEMGLTPAPAPAEPGRDAVVAAERARARADRLSQDAAEAERRLEIAERAVEEARRRAVAARTLSEEASREAVEAEEALDAKPATS